VDEARALGRFAHEASKRMPATSQMRAAGLNAITDRMLQQPGVDAGEVEVRARAAYDAANESGTKEHKMAAQRNLCSALLAGRPALHPEGILVGIQALDSARELLGVCHPSTVALMCTISVALMRSGDIAAAEPLLRGACMPASARAHHTHAPHAPPHAPHVHVLHAQARTRAINRHGGDPPLCAPRTHAHCVTSDPARLCIVYVCARRVGGALR
jgi:hypothetical protein